MIDTIMFDLDGTIVPLDADDFINAYFAKLTSKVKGIYDPNAFIKQLYASTMDMINNHQANKTNQEAFFDSFLPKIDYPADKIIQLFNDFYSNEYRTLKNLVNGNKHVQSAIVELKEKGYRLVLATNPIFPEMALKDRLSWAGINPDYFDYVTSYENMHNCKPYIEYYKEILQILDKDPSKCLMIGNDMEEDIVASKLGIKTYLVDEFKIDRKTSDLKPDYSGKYEDLYEFCKQMPTLLA